MKISRNQIYYYYHDGQDCLLWWDKTEEQWMMGLNDVLFDYFINMKNQAQYNLAKSVSWKEFPVDRRGEGDHTVHATYQEDPDAFQPNACPRPPIAICAECGCDLWVIDYLCGDCR